jgi:hypothetical protein
MRRFALKGHWKWSFNLLHHLFAVASLKRLCEHVLQKCCTHKLKSSIVVVACIDKVDPKLVKFSNGSTVAQLVRNILSRNLIKTWWDKIVKISKGRQYPYLWRESQCVESEIHTLQTQSEKEVNYTSECYPNYLSMFYPGPPPDSPPNSNILEWPEKLDHPRPPKLWFKCST